MSRRTVALLLFGVALACVGVLSVRWVRKGRWEQPGLGGSHPTGRSGVIDGSDYMLEDPSVPPLLRALRLGDVAKAHALIAAGAGVNVSDRYGFTPLMIAVVDAKGAVSELLAAGAAVDARDNVEGQTALFVAAAMGDLSASEQLVHHGADVNLKARGGAITPLAEAAGSCSAPLTRFLIRHGASVNAKNDGGGTALMSAVVHGCTDVVEVLIGARADVNARDRFGETALSIAERDRSPRIVHLLRRAGARE